MKMEDAKKKKSENSLLLEQTFKRKIDPLSLLNITENSSLIWNDRNKDIENHKPVSFTSTPE